MSLFEFTFTLTSVILGLALTHMAAVLHKLVLAGRRVKWAPEPLLLAAIVFSVVVSVWLFQWGERRIGEVTIGLIFLQTLKMMAVYIAAASVLPEIDINDGEEIDLHAYYDRTRGLTYGALITGLLLFDSYYMLTGNFRWDVMSVLRSLLYPALYMSLIFIRWRPYNVVMIAAGLGYYLWGIVGMRLVTS